MSLNGRRIQSPGAKETILLALEDVTQLKHSEDTLHKLSNRIMNIEDEERRRIARDVHDVTGQKVAALRLNLRLLAKKAALTDADRTLAESLELADQITDEVRSLSYMLHPPVLDELGLVPAVREYVEGISERTGLRINMEVPKEFPELSDDIEITIFRVIQESLGNIHRHSGSADARIRLSRNGDEIELRIEDSGHGFETRTDQGGNGTGAKRGVGITGMKERISHLRGTFEISSGAKGTTVLARLPFPD
jgi:signal transduction histidine kinase